MIISKNTKIFLIIFSAVLLLITIGAIVYKKTHNNSIGSQIIIESAQKIPNVSNEDVNGQNKEIKRLTLDSTYSNNGLSYSEAKDEERDIDVRYVQISGLKSENIQESINRQIKERINKILDSNNFKRNSDDSAYVRTTVTANFSDVLSIKIFVRFKDGYNKTYGLNFSLDNGEKIGVADLFTYDAPKKNIITESAYRSFALGYYTEEGISNEFYTNIEDDVIEFLTDYNNGEITEFSFTPLTIELYKEGKTVTIDMTKYYNYIAIYTEFVSSSDLYNSKSNVAEKIPVFVNRPESIVDLYEKVNDSCTLDVIIYSDEDFNQKEKKTIENYTKDLKEQLSSIKMQKGIYYSNYIKVSKSKENNEEILVFHEDECVARTDEGKFQDEVYSKIIMAERDLNNLSYSKSKIHILDDDSLESASEDIRYNVNTGKKIEDESEEDDNGDQENNNENDTRENTDTKNSPAPSASPSPSPATSPTPTPSVTPSPTGEITTKVTF